VKIEAWIARLFFFVALLQIAPIWCAPYFPTADGPAHLYNAWVMRELVLHHDNAVTRTYAIDAKPYPNLLDHAALAMLLGPFPPPVAEKIFVSAIVALFLGGLWLFAGTADPRASLFAFLGLPLAHHLLLQSGFYNFSLGAALYFVIIAVWWRRRDRDDGQTIAIVALLLILCYFAHPMPALLAIGTIGLLALLRRRPRHLLAFLPVLPLLAWFLAKEHGGGERTWTWWNRLTFLAQTQDVVTWSPSQLRFGAALCTLTVALIAITILVERRRRDVDAFLLVLAAVLVIYAIAPSSTAGGAMVLERLALFIALLPLPWLTPRLGARGRAAFAIVMAVVGAAQSVYLIRHDRRIAHETVALVRAARAIPPDSTVLPVVFDRQPKGTLLALTWHATAYAAIDRRLVDLNNYEPGTGYFPIRYRDARMKGIESIADSAAGLEARALPFAPYIFFWRAADDVRLGDPYALVAASADARIYRRRTGDFDALLLPIAGTSGGSDGPYGERWSVDQEIRNGGARPVSVVLSACTTPPCGVILAPGERRRIGNDDRWDPYIVAYVERPNRVEVTTTVRRVDRDGTTSALAIPSIPFTAFRSNQLDFGNVPPAERFTLRLWVLGPAPAGVTIDGNAVSTDANGFLKRPLAAGGRIRVSTKNARLWGFVTATGARGAGTLYLPR
jgi:hypothetical protein